MYTLFVGLDMTDLTTIRAFPLGSLLLLSARNRGLDFTIFIESRGGYFDAFGLFALVTSFAILLKTSQFFLESVEVDVSTHLRAKTVR